MARVALLPLIFVAGCGGSAGRLVVRDVPYGASSARLVASTPDGWRVIDLAGTIHEELFPAAFAVEDVSDDGETWVLTDSDTNLYVAARGGEPARIAELDGRLSEAALSPDGRTVAAVRHADFSLPQSAWRDDDAVYLVDRATKSVRTLPAATDAMPTGLLWETDGAAVWVGVWPPASEPSARHWVRVDVATNERSPAAELPKDGVRYPPVGHSSTPCGPDELGLVEHGSRGDEGFDLVGRDRPARHLVVVEDRRRGFHDYQPTVSDPFFTPDCRHAVFRFHSDLWSVDVETGGLRQLCTRCSGFFD